MVKMMLSSLVVFAGVLAACGSSSSTSGGSGSGSGAGTTTTTAGAEYTTKYKALITSYCAGCHVSGGQSPDLSSFDKVRTHRADMIEEIEAGTMPKILTTQWTSTDKAQMLNYLKNSTDFK